MSSASPVKRSLPSLQSHSKSTFSPSRALPRKTASKASLIDDVQHLSYTEEDSLVSRSKQRVEDLSKCKGQDNETSSALRRQLAARDWYIEILKEKLIEARIVEKSLESESVSSKERTIQQLTREKAELLKTVQTMELENQKLLQRMYSDEYATSESPASQIVEDLQSQVAGLKAEMATKDAFVASMKLDLGQLSEIVSGMTTLNTDLNSKLAKLTLDMEEKEKVCYQALSKAQHFDETEKTLAEQIGERQRLESQVKKLTESTQKMMDITEATVELRAAFASLESRLPGEFAMQIDHLKGILSRLDSGKVRKTGDFEAVKNKAKQMELELRSVNRELARAGVNESALRSRLSTLEAEREVLKADMKTTIDSLNATVALLQAGFKDFASRYDKLTEDYQKLSSESSKTAMKVAALQGRLDGALTAAAQSMKAEGKAVIALKEAQIQLSAAKVVKTSADAALQVREQRVKEETARLKVTSEELWRRDTFILKKSAQILALQDQLKSMQALLLQAQLKAKLAPAINRGNKSSESRGRFTPLPQKGGVELHRIRSRAHQSRSMVFNRLPLELLATDKQRIALETLAKALSLYQALRNGGEADLSLLEEILEGAGNSENRLELVREKVGRMVEELDTLLKGNSDGVPLGWVAESLRSTLQANDEELVQPDKLVLAIKEAVNSALL